MTNPPLPRPLQSLRSDSVALRQLSMVWGREAGTQNLSSTQGLTPVLARLRIAREPARFALLPPGPL